MELIDFIEITTISIIKSTGFTRKISLYEFKLIQSLYLLII